MEKQTIQVRPHRHQIGLVKIVILLKFRYPIILDLLVDVSLVGAIGVFSKEISKYIISDHQDRHIWQLCISTLVCFLVWCSASVPRSKIHRKPLRFGQSCSIHLFSFAKLYFLLIRKQRGKADLSVYSSICSTCSSPSPLPSLNNSCNSSPTGSGRESPMDMETCDIVSTHSALETLQIGSKIQPKFGN